MGMYDNLPGKRSFTRMFRGSSRGSINDGAPFLDTTGFGDYSSDPYLGSGSYMPPLHMQPPSMPMPQQFGAMPGPGAPDPTLDMRRRSLRLPGSRLSGGSFSNRASTAFLEHQHQHLQHPWAYPDPIGAAAPDAPSHTSTSFDEPNAKRPKHDDAIALAAAQMNAIRPEVRVHLTIPVASLSLSRSRST